MHSPKNHNKRSNGFSLLELIIAMAITLTIMTATTTLLASAFRIRTRENQKSDGLADVQRALNIMSREIADSGFNLSTNGIVDAESGLHAIRIRSNLNKYDFSPGVSDESRANVQDKGEDVSYFINAAEKTNYLARHDAFAPGPYKSTVLANRIDHFNIHYYAQKVTYTSAAAADDIENASATEVTPSAARYIVIAVSVRLNEIGSPGAPGYQPPYSVLLCSDVMLRNSDLWGY
jgi:prepilin-type N-terminal cleavage/methylation domain-containing protein